MHRLIGISTILLAMLALLSPSFATGICVAHGGLPIVSTAGGDSPVHVPGPCEMQGGKRVLPAQADFARHAIVDPYAIAALWAGGLRDDLLRQGRVPALELPPPRNG
jgi:hypothetical protein